MTELHVESPVDVASDVVAPVPRCRDHLTREVGCSVRGFHPRGVDTVDRGQPRL